MIANPEVAGGKTSNGNVIHYFSAKITLSTASSYDAELHACSDAGEIRENTQATMAELAFFGPRRWNVSTRLEKGHRVPLLVVIDAKGLWTKIHNEYKTENGELFTCAK